MQKPLIVPSPSGRLQHTIVMHSQGVIVVREVAFLRDQFGECVLVASLKLLAMTDNVSLLSEK